MFLLGTNKMLSITKRIITMVLIPEIFSVRTSIFYQSILFVVVTASSKTVWCTYIKLFINFPLKTFAYGGRGNSMPK